MKIDLNLDIVWYFYALSTNDEALEYITVLNDGSSIAGGCYTSLAYKQYNNKICDITFFRVSSTGTLMWAKSTGGDNTD